MTARGEIHTPAAPRRGPVRRRSTRRRSTARALARPIARPIAWTVAGAALLAATLPAAPLRATDPPPPPCCDLPEVRRASLRVEGEHFTIAATDAACVYRVRFRDESGRDAGPAVCDAIATLAISRQPGGWTLHPLGGGRWRLAPDHPEGGSPGCIVLRASHSRCERKATATVRAVRAAFLIRSVDVPGTLFGDGHIEWEPRAVHLYSSPGVGLGEGGLVDVSADPAEKVRLELPPPEDERSSRCARDKYPVRIRGTAAARPGDRVTITARVRRRCPTAGTRDPLDSFEVCFGRKLVVAADRAEPGGGGGGGGRLVGNPPGGGGGGYGAGEAGSDIPPVDEMGEPFPRDRCAELVEAAIEAAVSGIDLTAAAGGLDPCDPLAGAPGDPLHDATWCWAPSASAEVGDTSRLGRFWLKAAPPFPDPLEQPRGAAPLFASHVDPVAGRRVHRLTVGVWEGFADGEDPTQRSGAAKLLEVSWEALPAIFNPSLGARWADLVAQGGAPCDGPVPAGIVALASEYGILEAWVRVRLVEREGGGRVRLTFRGGQVSSHPRVDRDDLVPEFPWRALLEGTGAIDVTGLAATDAGWSLPNRVVLHSSGHCHRPDAGPGVAWLPTDRSKVRRSSHSRFFWLEVFGERASAVRDDIAIELDMLLAAPGEVVGAPDWSRDDVIRGPRIALTVIGPRLREIELTDRGERRIDAEYLHLGVATPRVVIDPGLCWIHPGHGTVRDTLTLGGRVRSPLAAVDQPGRYVVTVRGERIDVASNGTFFHAVELIEPEGRIDVRAGNPLGGWGADSLLVSGAEIVQEPGRSAHSWHQQLRLGSRRAVGHMVGRSDVRLVLRQAVGEHAGARVGGIGLRLRAEGDDVVSLPFLVSSTGPLRSPEHLRPLEDDVLVVPGGEDDVPEGERPAPLFHDLWLEVDDVSVRVAQAAGVRITLPETGSIVRAGSDVEVPTDLTLTWRNVDASGLRVRGYSDLTREVFDITKRVARSRETDSVLAKAVPLLRGPNSIWMEARDLAGRPVDRAVCRTFICNDSAAIYQGGNLPHRASRPESPAKAATFAASRREWPDPTVEVVPSGLTFRVRAGTPLVEVSRECRRLGLHIVGRTVHSWSPTDDCGETRIDTLTVTPTAGVGLETAIGLLRASPIHAESDQREDPHLIPPARFENWPEVDVFAFLYAGADHNPQVQARVRADRYMNDRNASALDRAVRSGPRHLLVADLRVDKLRTHFDRVLETGTSPPHLRARWLQSQAFSRRAPYRAVLEAPPEFRSRLTGDDGRPEYRIDRYEMLGVDQVREGARDPGPLPLSGVRPRVWLRGSCAGPGPRALAPLLAGKRGAIVTLHGFRLDTDLHPPDGRAFAAERQMAGRLWPCLQHLLREHLRAQGGDPDEWLLLHVIWTGDWHHLLDGGDQSLGDETLWYNWDDALARYTGRTLLRDLLRDIEAIGRGNSGWRGTRVLANSAGARATVSSIHALSLAEPVPPRRRLILGHPALRRTNLVRPVRDVVFGGIDTDLQRELCSLRILDPTSAGSEVLMFYSPYDKAGLAFAVAQGDSMLGRCGLPVGYEADATPRVGICARYATGQDPEGRACTDLWHVVLMGWNLPGMCFRSRPTYLQNRGWWRFGFLKTTERILEVKEAHINAIWNDIGRFIARSETPCDPIWP